MAEDEKKPRRRRSKKVEEPSDTAILAHNQMTLGIATMKLLQAIYAETRAATFYILSQSTELDAEGAVETFRHAQALQVQGTDLVRGAWHDLRGGDVPNEEPTPDIDPEEDGLS